MSSKRDSYQSDDHCKNVLKSISSLGINSEEEKALDRRSSNALVVVLDVVLPIVFCACDMMGFAFTTTGGDDVAGGENIGAPSSFSGNFTPFLFKSINV